MAKKLPKYEKTAGFNYEGMAQLTDVVTRQEAATGERINKFLSGVTQDFRQQGIQYATDQAIEDAIRNPIARATGDNPVTKYLQGGTAYNEAMTKMLGQQVAGELNITLAKHNSDLLEQVRLGQIENSETLLLKLSEPIKAQVEFFTDIDPEMAAQFGSKATLSARNSYLQGDQIFKGLKEKKAYADAITTIQQNNDDYNRYLKAYPDATDEQKIIYKDTIEKIAIDTSLSMSREQLKLTEEMRNTLNETEDMHVAEDIAIKYKGNELAEVLTELSKDKTNVGEYYNNKNIVDQDVFQRKISNALTVQNSGLAEIQRKVKQNVRESKVYIDTFQRIPQQLVDKINKDIDVNSDAYIAWQTLQKFSDNIEIYNATPYVELVDSLNAARQNNLDITKVKTPEELGTFDLLNRYVSNINTDQLIERVQTREKQLGTYGPLYGLSEAQYTANIMTKSEVSGFVNAYMNGDGATRVALLQTIDKGFGDSNSQALMQLVNGGLPATAELSSYFGDPVLTEKLISFDSKEKRDDLKSFAKDNETSYQAIRILVRERLEDFEEVVMIGSNLNTTVATKKLESITDTLTYLALQEMQTNPGYDAGDGAEAAADLINNSYTLENDYYIPNIYGGNPTNPEQVAAKASLIKDHYLQDFNPVAFRSDNPDITDEEYNEEMRDQMIENGVWRNSADGTSLVYGVVLPSVGFTPIENDQGQLLSFKFNDLSYTLPNTDVVLDTSKAKFDMFNPTPDPF